MKWVDWVLAGLVVWCILCVLAVILALAKKGGLRAWRCVWVGQCDPQWLWNEREPIVGSYNRLGANCRWVGVYRCRHCYSTSYGAAKHEQMTRVLRPEPDLELPGDAP